MLDHLIMSKPEDETPPIYYHFTFPPPSEPITVVPARGLPASRFLHDAETYTGKFDPTRYPETVKLLVSLRLQLDPPMTEGEERDVLQGRTALTSPSIRSY
ncbi:hypothetical protein RQP46_001010 [Phenoliferia psychrophenolica]